MIVRKILFIVAIISALGISTTAAEEAEPTDPIASNDSHQGMIMELEEEVDHSEMSQTEHKSEKIEHEGEQAGHESEQTEQTEQGHHKVVVETPPNYKVLGGLAFVNLLFIMIGVYMKWFYRKGASA